MKVEAMRGVCIGPERHLKVGETADLDEATVRFLVGIGAVKAVPDAQPQPEPEPVKAGKKEK